MRDPGASLNTKTYYFADDTLSGVCITSHLGCMMIEVWTILTIALHVAVSMLEWNGILLCRRQSAPSTFYGKCAMQDGENWMDSMDANEFSMTSLESIDDSRVSVDLEVLQVVQIMCVPWVLQVLLVPQVPQGQWVLWVPRVHGFHFWFCRLYLFGGFVHQFLIRRRTCFTHFIRRNVRVRNVYCAESTCFQFMIAFQTYRHT